MAELLITGGAGFIGANFTRYWRQAYPSDGLTVLDALTYAANPASLEGIPDVSFIHGDIRDYELIRRLLEERAIDTLVHFAAETHVDRSIHGPDAFIGANIVGTHELLKAAKTVWLDGGTGKPHRFHHVSTDEVFGSLGPFDPAFSETTAYRPNSPYSASKAASDHLVRAYHHTFGLQATASNCSNNYGPYQFPEEADSSVCYQRPAWQASADLRRRTQCAQLAIRGRPLSRPRTRRTAGPSGRNIQHRRRHGISELDHYRPHLR